MAWADQMLTNAAFAYGENIPVNEQGYVEYAGQVMTEAAANTAYQNDLAQYNAMQSAAKANPGNVDIQGPKTVDQTKAPTAPSSPAIDQMVAQYVGKADPNDLAALQTQLKAGGFLTTTFTPGVADEATTKAMGDLLYATTEALGNNSSATWQSVLSNSISANGWAVDAQGNMTRTEAKTPSINAMSAQAAITPLLGRRATPGEIQSFIDNYNQNVAGQLDTTETVTKAGVDTTNAPSYATQSQTIQAAELAAAQQNPDYATYQAATTYWNAMQQALGATGNVENNLK